MVGGVSCSCWKVGIAHGWAFDFGKLRIGQHGNVAFSLQPYSCEVHCVTRKVQVMIPLPKWHPLVVKSLPLNDSQSRPSPAVKTPENELKRPPHQSSIFEGLNKKNDE